MKQNLLFNQASALGKRLAMVLTMLLVVGIGQAWGQYTKASSIAVGDVVVLVYESGKKELSSISSYGVGTSYNGTPAGVYELTVEAGSSSGTFSLKNGSTYLSWSSGNSLATTTSKNSNSSWKITFSGGNATILNAKDNSRKLQWNASSPRFACYTSSQTAVQLYKKAASTYTVTATSNNDNYGTVSVNGTTITAKPADCYQVVSGIGGYTIKSGTAAVTHEGNSNTLTVNASTDCSIQVNFEKKPVNTYIDNVQENEEQELCGNHFAPSLTDKAQATTGTCEQQHWHFMGWVTEANKENPADANIVKANTSVTANGTTYYAVWAKGTTTGGGSTSKQYSFDITPSNFNSTSYAANNNEKTSTAKASDGSTLSVKWTSNQVMLQSSAMQWQKSAGYIYNSTDLGTINSVTVTKSAGTFTTYYGTAKQPSSSTTVGNGYFQIKVGSDTGKTSKVTITFTKTTTGGTTTTYSDYTTQCATETAVTLHPNGGAIDGDSNTQEIQTENGTLTLPTPTRVGYTFTGWNTNEYGSGDTFEAGEYTDWNESITNLHAQWCATLSAPTGLNATPTKDGATIYWNKVTGASGYEISINDGNWISVDAGDNPSYNVTGIECGGTTVTYVVRAVGDTEKGYCDYSPSSEKGSFKTSLCDCPNTYSFHYKNDGNWIANTVICFSPVEGATYLTDELYLPYSQFYKVAWQGQDQSYSVETEYSGNMPFYHNRDKKFGANPQHGNLGGGKGKFHVYHDSGDNNKYISFIPTGYTLNFGSGDEWNNDQTLYFTPKTSNWDEKEWYTDLVTLTNDQINKQIFVGLQTEVDYVWCEPYSEKLNIAGMRTKTGSGDNWVDGGMNTSYTNKTGKFRIYADSGDKNWYVTFVPHYQLKYNANGGTGTMNPMPAEPVSCEDTETNRTFKVAANTFTRDNYNFTGWNTKADGTGQAYAVNNDIVLTGDITLYAQWEQQSCPAYSFHTGGSDVWNTREEDHCFVQKGSTSEWRIDNYIRPNHTHYVVNWQGGKHTNGGSQNATFASRSWDNMPFANVRSATVGQSSYGVKGSLRIYDDSNQENLYISFIPDAYVLEFGTTEYAITQHSGNDYRSEIVEYAASASANYSVSVGVADADGHYVATNHTQEMRHIFLKDNVGWRNSGAKIAIYYWGGSTGWCGFLKTVPGDATLFEGWIPTNATNIKLVRYNSNKGVPGDWNDIWNQSGDIKLSTTSNLFTITSWDSQTTGWSAYSSKGKFRMHDDSGDKNWYVHFYPHYVLTYNQNHADATGSMEQQSVPKDASSKAITIAECRFARIGYDFVAWNANMNGQGTSYNPGDTYTLNADKTLYAKWAPQRYEIIYKDQGNVAFSGENTTSLPATHTYGTATAIPDGVKTGYTFGGWYDNPECTGTALTQLGATDYTADITLYAKWTIKTHTVTWKPAGGNWGGNFDDIVEEYAYGEEIKAPENPAYDCHEFDAWDPVYTVGMTMPDEDLVFTAKWNKLSYTITFKNYDGTVLQTSTVECGETPSYTGATPTREQTAQYTYTFKAWSPTIAPATQDQVYTAQFTSATRSYTVIWYDGTGNAHETQTANYNATVALPTTNPDPCDDEYPHFIGWTADHIVGSTTTQPTLVENVKVTGDCDYYAVFAKGEAGENGSYTLDYTAESLGSSNKWGSYGTAYEHTAKDGSTWVIKAYKNAGMQINTGKNASIKIPACPSPITSIEVTGTTSKAVGLSASDYTGSGTITYIASGTDATNQTLDLSEKSVTGGYIVAKSGSISITKITVNFTAPTNYTSFITTCCTSWSAPTLTYTTPLEENGTATPQITGTTHGTVTYESSNPSILSVNSTTGEITAKAPGTAKITATWSGDATYCSVSSNSNVITVKGSFSVIYYSNGGTGTMPNQKADENNVIAQLNANQFTRDGYAFVGWNTKANGTGTAYADQATNITLTGNLTLYAQWAAIVTLNDAGTETTTHPATAGGTITLPDGANACPPYEFVGWTAVAIGDWNEGINEPALVATTYKPSAPTTLYAVYKIQSEGNANAFKLSFEGGNGKTYYVGEYGSSPYLRGYSNITEADAVTFIRKKMFPNDDTKYYLYLEHLEEYLYCSSGNLYTTSNEPSESQGWVFHTVGDKIQIQAINQERYLSYSDRDDDRINITTHSTGSQESFNMLSAVTSTYVASPLCNQEIEITFETGNGNFVDNAPDPNPLTVSRGDVIPLPTCEYPGYEFMGWLKDEQQLDPSDIPLTYYTGDYTVNGTSSTITFYAYYKAIPEEVEFTGKDDVELLMYYYDGTANYYYAVSHAAERGELSSKQNCFNATTWTFTNVGNMQYHIQDETGKYLGAYSDGDNDLILSATPKVWTFTEVNGLWKMVCENSPSRALMYISTRKNFTNAAISNEGNGAYSYVTLGICPYPTYTTNPVLSQGFSITNTAMVTSASGQKVKATSALTLETRNIELPCTFTISAPNITFYDNTGAEVTQLTSSAASEQFELHFAYKPTAENTMEYPTITITDDEMKTYTIKNRIYARSLPATFAIVAKVGNLWYALPSQGLNSTTPPAAYPVEVDNMADPTAVTAVPENADWSLRGVYEASRSDATKDRYVANGDNLVFVNNASPAMALNASTSGNYLLTDAQYANYYQTNPGLYEWTPTTTDLETYQLTNEQRSRTLSVNTATVFGVHATDKAVEQVRFLPIQNRYTPAALQVVEWKENSVVIMYNGDPAQTASVSVSGAAAQNTTLSAAPRDTAVYELAANGLATNPTQRLSITIGTEKAILPIPYIISGEKTDLALLPGSTVAARQEVAKVADLVVLKDAKLTADGAKSNPYKFRNVTIYGGGKLVIPSDKGFGVSSLTMRVGAVESGNYKALYPQLVLNGSINTGNINIDYLTTYDRYYALSLPYEVATTDILYPTDIYGDVLNDGGNKASFALQWYDGEARASETRKGWTDLQEPATLEPYKGYTFWGAPRKVSVNGESKRQNFGIHRIPIKPTANDLITGETTGKQIKVYAYPATNAYDAGWNFIGNPYLAQYGNMEDGHTSGLLGMLTQNPETGVWEHTGNYRYITLTDDGKTYWQTPVSEAELYPFNTFFVQAGENGAISFNASNRASLPARHYAAQQETAKEITTGILLTGNDQTDRTGLLIADNFTEEYDYNADLSKFENSGINLYTIGKDGKLAYMAINQALAEQPIPVGYTAPAEGLYTIAFDEDRYNATDISALYLIDYDSNEKTNLLYTDYSFVTAAGTNNQRFALQVAFAPENATNVEWVGDATVQVGVEGNMLILNNLPTDAAVHVFDALGRLMYHTPHAPTEMQLTLPTGYYLVRIADKQHAAVINTVIP